MDPNFPKITGSLESGIQEVVPLGVNINRRVFSFQVAVDGVHAMTGATFFVRSCPTCGRMLEIRIELLGRVVACQHCSAQFRAGMQSETQLNDRRVEQLLAQADQQLHEITPYAVPSEW